MENCCVGLDVRDEEFRGMIKILIIFIKRGIKVTRAAGVPLPFHSDATDIDFVVPGSSPSTEKSRLM